jgi:uncharacterized protein YebE (UPF0316 family)
VLLATIRTGSFYRGVCRVLEYLQANPWLLAIAIFVARVLDVSIGTVRTIIVFRGHRYWAAALGFAEVLIWLVAAAQVFQNLDVWYLAIAYAGGFAAGNVVGIALEARLAIGLELVRVVSETRHVALSEHLRDAGYSVTELSGHGESGLPVEVLLVVEKRRRVPALLDAIHAADPKALWTLSDVRRQPPPPTVRQRGVPGSLLSQIKRK